MRPYSSFPSTATGSRGSVFAKQTAVITAPFSPLTDLGISSRLRSRQLPTPASTKRKERPELADALQEFGRNPRQRTSGGSSTTRSLSQHTPTPPLPSLTRQEPASDSPEIIGETLPGSAPARIQQPVRTQQMFPPSQTPGTPTTEGPRTTGVQVSTQMAPPLLSDTPPTPRSTYRTASLIRLATWYRMCVFSATPQGTCHRY